MGYKRKRTGKKKTFKKKIYKKKYNKLSSTVSPTYGKDLVNFGSAFPKKALIKQRYVDTVSMTATTGTFSHTVICLNGLYDPNVTTSGHQPMYFDQMMALYNHYYVIGAKMTVKLIGYESNTVPANCILWMNDDTAVTPSTANNLIEEIATSATLLGSGGDTSITLSLKYSPKKTFGGSVLANVSLQGSATANPDEGSYGYISVQAADLASTVSVIAQIIVEYIVIYTELKDIGGS